MHDFLELLRSWFITHIFEYFFNTFLKPFSERSQIFSKFRQSSTLFLRKCSFKSSSHISSEFFCRRSYSPRCLSKVAWKFIKKIHFSVEIFLQRYGRVSKIFSITFLRDYFLNINQHALM